MPVGANWDLASYVAILLWCGQLVQQNSIIVSEFGRYLRRHAGGRDLPADVGSYQAVAVEWFLLGIVEIPPPGIRE